MALTLTQEKIEGAIISICVDEPVATAQDIADFTGLTKRAVLDNVDDVLEEKGDLKTRKIGQANVFYVKKNRGQDLWTDDIDMVKNLTHIPGSAAYGTLELLPEDCEYNAEIKWYDAELDELEGYEATHEEIGAIIGAYLEDLGVRT